MSWLGDMLGFEIGSVVIDGKTYAKAVIKPTFSIGKLKMSLYMPVIYTSDLFNPNTLVQAERQQRSGPSGYEYWGQGSSPGRGGRHARPWRSKYGTSSMGTRLFDPVYLKVGNLSSMTIGHGVLMRNFANDSDFPAIRRVGLERRSRFRILGVWKALVNDLAEPEIYRRAL